MTESTLILKFMTILCLCQHGLNAPLNGEKQGLVGNVRDASINKKGRGKLHGGIIHGCIVHLKPCKAYYVMCNLCTPSYSPNAGLPLNAGRVSKDSEK